MPKRKPAEDKASIMEKELLRFTFCGIILASFFATLAGRASLETVLGRYGTNLAGSFLGLSAAFSFAYILSVASWLKYRSPRRIDRFPMRPKLTQFFYD